MEAENDILSSLIKRPKPDVPEHFFKTFSQDLCAQLTASEQEAEPDFVKRTQSAVPADFFAGFYDTLKAEIDAEKPLEDLGLVKRKKPLVPENFEQTFSANVLEQVQQKPSRGRLLKITFWSTAAAVAAGLALLLTINTNTPAPQNPMVVTQPAALPPDDESLEAFVAYLDEEAMVDYIIENNINVGESETADEVYDYVDSELEEIYMDL